MGILDIASVLSAEQAVTVTAVTTGVYDCAGLGVGQTVTNITGLANGAVAAFGEDLGGGGPLVSGPQLSVAVGATAFTAGGAGTLTAQLQCAVDAGAGVPGTWKTIVQTDAIPVASLTAGVQVASYTVPDRYIGQGFPRFYRVNYVVATGPMLTGTVNSRLQTGIDDNPLYPANY